MQRKDGPAIRDTLIWFAALGLSRRAWHLFLGQLVGCAGFRRYGVLYGSAGDSRWHECSHGTAFSPLDQRGRVSTSVPSSCCGSRCPGAGAISRHHTDTIIVGRDPEIAVPRPTNLFHVVARVPQFAAWEQGAARDRAPLLRPHLPKEKDYIPESERHKVYLTARILRPYLRHRHRSVDLVSELPAADAGRPAILLRRVASFCFAASLSMRDWQKMCWITG